MLFFLVGGGCGGAELERIGFGHDVFEGCLVAAWRDVGVIHDRLGLVLPADLADRGTEVLDLALGHFGGEPGVEKVELGLPVEEEERLAVVAQVEAAAVLAQLACVPRNHQLDGLAGVCDVVFPVRGRDGSFAASQDSRPNSLLDDVLLGFWGWWPG